VGPNRIRHKLVGALVAAGISVGGVILLGAAVPSAEQASKSTPCGTIRHAATTQLHIVGKQIRDSSGRVVEPNGISLVSGPETVNWARSERAVAAQIDAAHNYWHANAVRIQISETMLFKDPTRGRGYNVKFAQSVDRLICRIVKHGDIPIINDTTIFTGREPGPGRRSIKFWRFISKRYGNRFPAIFDLFNEPQVTRNPLTKQSLPDTTVWQIWRSGGTVGGIKYVGMQDLVNEIRVKQGVKNVIWAEEPYYVDFDRASLGLLPDHLLKGGDIVYAFHKPNLKESSPSYRDLRAVADQGIPLVDSEWVQYAATDRPWECQEGSYETAPPYLKFLRTASIGMIAWSLQPGALVKGVAGVDTVHDGNDWRYTSNPRDLAEPNEMNADYGCTSSARGQGVGRLVMDYFARNSARPPATLFPKLG
jgi:Cellulase (glycosyl hydrolase family 5)